MAHTSTLLSCGNSEVELNSLKNLFLTVGLSIFTCSKISFTVGFSWWYSSTKKGTEGFINFPNSSLILNLGSVSLLRDN